MSVRVLHVDFNEIDEDGLLHTLFDPYGEWALVDGDGNRARGIVVSIENGVARIRIDWDTWQPNTPDTPEQAREIAETNAAVRRWAAASDDGDRECW